MKTTTNTLATEVLSTEELMTQLREIMEQEDALRFRRQLVVSILGARAAMEAL